MITNLDRVERRRVQNGDYHFLCEVYCCAKLGEKTDKWTVTAELSAADIQTYASFQRAMLKKCGLMFVAPGYEGRGGKEAWSADVQEMIGAPAGEVAEQ